MNAAARRDTDALPDMCAAGLLPPLYSAKVLLIQLIDSDIWQKPLFELCAAGSLPPLDGAVALLIQHNSGGSGGLAGPHGVKGAAPCSSPGLS